MILDSLIEKLRGRHDDREKTALEKFFELAGEGVDGTLTDSATDVRRVEGVISAAGKDSHDLELAVARVAEARSLAGAAADFESRRQALFDAKAGLLSLEQGFDVALKTYQTERATRESEIASLSASMVEAGGARNKLANEFGGMSEGKAAKAEIALAATVSEVEQATATRDRAQTSLDQLQAASGTRPDDVTNAVAILAEAEAAVVEAQDALAEAETVFAGK